MNDLFLFGTEGVSSIVFDFFFLKKMMELVWYLLQLNYGKIVFFDIYKHIYLNSTYTRTTNKYDLNTCVFFLSNFNMDTHGVIYHKWSSLLNYFKFLWLFKSPELLSSRDDKDKNWATLSTCCLAGFKNYKITRIS